MRLEPPGLRPLHVFADLGDLRLADAMNPPEPLLQPVRVPGEVVINHQVSALEVDALASRIGCHEDFDVRLALERRFVAAPQFSWHSAVDLDHSLLAAN